PRSTDCWPPCATGEVCAPSRRSSKPLAREGEPSRPGFCSVCTLGAGGETAPAGSATPAARRAATTSRVRRAVCAMGQPRGRNGSGSGGHLSASPAGVTPKGLPDQGGGAGGPSGVCTSGEGPSGTEGAPGPITMVTALVAVERPAALVAVAWSWCMPAIMPVVSSVQEKPSATVESTQTTWPSTANDTERTGAPSSVAATSMGTCSPAT